MTTETLPMTESELAVAASKGADGENFPVGSFLLPKALRPHVAHFYAFARQADDIADAPDLCAEDKVARLDIYAETLRKGEGPVPAAVSLHHSLAETQVTQKHALDLIDAFQQDAVKNRYANWAELMDYCNRSASPVGRYLLDLHGEDPAGYAASDALCNALQVINHLQDCAKDYLDMDRVYLPQDWMAAQGVGAEDLKAAYAPPGIRHVLNQCLQRTNELLSTAGGLPGNCLSRRLGAESAVILALAKTLTQRLAVQDPVARRVVLSKSRMAWIGLGAVTRYALL